MAFKQFLQNLFERVGLPSHPRRRRKRLTCRWPNPGNCGRSSRGWPLGA